MRERLRNDADAEKPRSSWCWPPRAPALISRSARQRQRLATARHQLVFRWMLPLADNSLAM
jgi:hypothetical protein